MKAGAGLAAVLLIAAWTTAGTHRLLLQTPPLPSANATQQTSTPPPSADDWPSEWPDVPIQIMSRGDLLARGGAMKALGRAKLQRISKQSYVTLDVEALAAKLDSEKDLYVDFNGEQLLSRCNMDLPRNGSNGSTPVPPTLDDIPISATGLTKAEVFNLSSRPGALKKIVLDFDGHNTTGTKWNIGDSPWFWTPPWDSDNDPTSFSENELADIKAVWSVVAEDYAPFDVDVTLRDPGVAALLGIGVRVVIGGPSPDGVTAGICWIGSFGTNNPCYVHSQSLFNDAKFVGETASHEAGHSFGLLHDGDTTRTYFGDGDWNPIMGVSHYSPISQWSKGEYAGADNKQDDYEVIGQFLDLLPQQHGSSIATATPLPSGTVSGIISRQGQVDFFSFNAGPGDITITASGAGNITTAAGRVYNIGDLDVQMTLYNSASTVLQSANPVGATAEAMGARVQVSLPTASTYYVSITGVGAGDPVGNGYSNYGSRGQYTLKVGDPIGTTDPIDPIDCTGRWECSKCNKKCGGGSRTCTFYVASAGQQGGLPCRFEDRYTKTVNCNLQGCPSGSSMSVVSLKLAKLTVAGGRVKCRAAAVVRETRGKALRNVRVVGRWASMTADVTATTSAVGVASFSSNPVTGNTCTFNVATATLAGYAFIAVPGTMTKTLRW